jgi:hypothetical protein
MSESTAVISPYESTEAPVLGQEYMRVIRQHDRRVNHRRAMWCSLYMRRRSGARRDIEQGRHYYIDLHETWLFYLAMAMCMLSVSDAFLTLKLLANGSEELNPLLNYFLMVDVRLFFVVKFLLTTFCILFLVMHKNFMLFNRISGLQVMLASIVFYTGLICYEISMLT